MAALNSPRAVSEGCGGTTCGRPAESLHRCGAEGGSDVPSGEAAVTSHRERGAVRKSKKK